MSAGVRKGSEPASPPVVSKTNSAPIGRFTHSGAAYEIGTPDTPHRWSNYLFNDDYYLQVSQTAQGLSRATAPVFMEFTRDFRQFYLLDEATGTSFNTNCHNPDARPGAFTCTHALGWTRIDATFGSFETSLRVFVPMRQAVEIWTYSVRNRSRRKQKVSLFSVFSLALRGATGVRAGFNPKTGMIEATGLPDAVFYNDWEKNQKGQRYAYLFADRHPASFDCSEERFFGSENLARMPVAVQSGTCSNTISEGENTVAAFQHRLTLGPGEEKEVHLVLGCSYKPGTAARMRAVFHDGAAVAREVKKVETYWRGVSSRFTVRTPDEHFDGFMNHWLKKQVAFGSRINRGSCIFPVRNPLQDAAAYAMLDGAFAKTKILELAALQDPNGYLHMWQVSKSEPEVPKIGMNFLKHKDAQVWLIVCTCNIAQQTADFGWLDAPVPYSGTAMSGSLYEHLLRAVDYMERDCGAHGLCLMGDGDWNDPLNGAGRLGKGESTWTTMGFKYALMQLLPLAQARGDAPTVRRFERLMAKLDRAVNKHCWDGNWYVAGFDDEGVPFGKAADKEGRILLNAQSWAIMSGVARGERLDRLLRTIDGIDSRVGPQTITPAFTKWNPVWGRISLWVPGTGENGGVYCHAAMFKAYADCLAGRGDAAYDTLRKIMPTNPENPPERNRQVPVFVPNCYFGLPDSSNFGRSTHSPVTGTAAWMMWVGVEHILGIQATVDGLTVNPCLPRHWREAAIRRAYRGATYDIRIANSGQPGAGVEEIVVNGSRLEGRVLPYRAGGVYRVEVTMAAQGAVRSCLRPHSAVGPSDHVPSISTVCGVAGRPYSLRLS